MIWTILDAIAAFFTKYLLSRWLTPKPVDPGRQVGDAVGQAVKAEVKTDEHIDKLPDAPAGVDVKDAPPGTPAGDLRDDGWMRQ